MTSVVSKSTRSETGFTLVEIVVVVAIVALLVSIAVPAYLRSRMRSQAGRILSDLRVLDAAVDQYAADNRKKPSAPVTFSDLKPYLKPGTPLYDGEGADLLGNEFTVSTVDEPPKVSESTASSLSEVAPPEFWGPYQ